MYANSFTHAKDLARPSTSDELSVNCSTPFVYESALLNIPQDWRKDHVHVTFITDSIFNLMERTVGIDRINLICLFLSPWPVTHSHPVTRCKKTDQTKQSLLSQSKPCICKQTCVVIIIYRSYISSVCVSFLKFVRKRRTSIYCSLTVVLPNPDLLLLTVSVN